MNTEQETSNNYTAEYVAKRLNRIQCKNCTYYEEDKDYKGEGKCNNDGRYTREHRVCNLLDTDKKRRDAKNG